jgi:hypothetical protein
LRGFGMLDDLIEDPQDWLLGQDLRLGLHLAAAL